jgi:hypothetical protein
MRCKAQAVVLHRNDACRLAVTATIKAVQTVPSGSKVSGAVASEREQHLRALADKLLF